MSAMEVKKELLVAKENGYSITYCLYKADGDKVLMLEDPEKELGKEKVTWRKNRACFAGLVSHIKDSPKKFNRLTYLIKDGVNNWLNDKEKAEWMHLCQDRGAIPGYVTEKSVIGGYPAIKLDDISPSMLYVYLTSLRYIQENPTFVRLMLYLNSEYKYNFYASWVLTSLLVCCNAGHNIVGLGYYSGGGGSYGKVSNTDVGSRKLPMRYVVGLRRLLGDPKRYDAEDIKDPKGRRDYNCSQTITSACKLVRLIKASDLLDRKVAKALDYKQDKTIAKHIGYLLERDTNYYYN